MVGSADVHHQWMPLGGFVMFGFVRGVRGRAVVVVLVVAGLVGGVTASSVAAATKTTVTWKVSSLTAGQEKNLSAVASTNSKGVKTWSKTGSCVLSPTSKPTKLTMGTGASCTLTLKIARSGKYPAKTSDQTITRKATLAPTTTTTTIALTCVTGGSCDVGYTGPGGGIVFYVDLTRPAGSQYFEAACAGWQNNCDGATADPRAEWGCYGNSIPGADGLVIGTGEQNTADILAECLTVGIAADLADDYSHNTLDDWFLPSQDELNQMYIQRTAIGGFSTDAYRSSSELADYDAWSRVFSCNVQNLNCKYFTGYVRPVRAF